MVTAAQTAVQVSSSAGQIVGDLVDLRGFAGPHPGTSTGGGYMHL